jgi:hypothetical protein
MAASRSMSWSWKAMSVAAVAGARVRWWYQ